MASQPSKRCEKSRLPVAGNESRSVNGSQQASTSIVTADRPSKTGASTPCQEAITMSTCVPMCLREGVSELSHRATGCSVYVCLCCSNINTAFKINSECNMTAGCERAVEFSSQFRQGVHPVDQWTELAQPCSNSQAEGVRTIGGFLPS